jgi:hypothetical protein
MQHRYAEWYVSEKLPPLGYQGGKLIGTGVACFVGALATFWASGPHEARHIAGFMVYLFLAGLFALLVVFIRRVVRRPEALRETTFEVNRHGLWRQTNASRTLLLGKAEPLSIEVFRSRLNVVLRVELRTKSKTLQVQGLEDMERFCQELRSNMPAAAFNVNHPKEELLPPRDEP